MIRRATIEDVATLAALEEAAEDENVIWGYRSQLRSGRIMDGALDIPIDGWSRAKYQARS